MKYKTNTSSAFTIIELLIVIVVIAVLAMIAIFSYAGMQNRAIDSRLQSDLRNNSKQLGVAYATDGTYPATRPALSTDPDTLLQYTRTSPTSYCLTVASQSNNKTFHMTNTSSIQEGPCLGHAIGTGGGEGGGSPSNDLYSLVTPEAIRLKGYVETIQAAPGQFSSYSMGVNYGPSLNLTPITSLFPEWTTEELTGTGLGGVDTVVLPTDPDGYRFALVEAPDFGGVFVAYLISGDNFSNPDTTSSAVLLTPDGVVLSPYVATVNDMDMLLDPGSRLPVIQYFAFQLLQVPLYDGSVLAEMTASDLVSSSMVSPGLLEAVSGPAGGPWTVRIVDPELAGFPANLTNCELTVEAQTPQYPRAVSYSCP